MKIVSLFVVICTAMVIASPAQTFTNLLNFDGNNGAEPSVGLVQGIDGDFYGTTAIGGSRRCAPIGCGGIFRIDSQGTLTGLDFEGADGSLPEASLILATNGNFYGTTKNGGSGVPCGSTEFPGCGEIFEVAAAGKLMTLYSFLCTQTGCPEGFSPLAALIQAADDNFYGTTFSGGSGTNGGGTVFKITPSGTLTTLYNFCTEANCADGYLLYAGLVQADDGNFYGATFEGGTYNYGTVFKITPLGKLTTLHSFDESDGNAPVATLVLGTDRNLYGTTSQGGDLTCAQPYGCGTVFKISKTGTLATLHIFEKVDGTNPEAGLILATDGNFYGTTDSGGLYGFVTVFSIAATGALTTLHNFNDSDGFSPVAALLQSTTGKFYGTTELGGDLACDPHYGCGTVFSLDVGLGPFVSFVHSSGKVGQMGGILGQGFTGTTNVSFNGIPANFSVKSDTFVTATVPAGATTGYVTVTAPNGTLTSNVPFNVIP